MRSEDWYTFGGKGIPAGFLAATAEGPDGRRIDIALAVRPEDTSIWDGDITFAVAGPWTLRMTRPEWSEEKCVGAALDLNVRSATEDSDVLPLAVLAGAGVAWIALAALHLTPIFTQRVIAARPSAPTR